MSISAFPLLSVVTVCYDRWQHLQRTWPQLMEQEYRPLEVIVVCNGADNGPLQLLHDPRAETRIVRIDNSAAYRASRFRNLGALAARGKYLAFVDSDVHLSSVWTNTVMREMQARPAGAVVINEAMTKMADAAGCSGTLAIHRWVFERIGGYNENLDLSWGVEDTDLIERAQFAGAQAIAYPAVLTQHRDHDDVLRNKHHVRKLPPRFPKTFFQQMKIAEADRAIHPYEANRVSRLRLPLERVVVLAKEA